MYLYVCLSNVDLSLVLALAKTLFPSFEKEYSTGDRDDGELCSNLIPTLTPSTRQHPPDVPQICLRLSFIRN